MATEIWKELQTVAQVKNIVQSVNSLVDPFGRDTPVANGKIQVSKAILDDRIQTLTDMIKTKLMEIITQMVSEVIRKIVSQVVHKLACMAISTTQRLVNKVIESSKPFDKDKKQTTSSETIKDSENINETKNQKEQTEKRHGLQNNIKDPRSNPIKADDETKTHRKPCPSDLQALSDMKWRNIKVTNIETTEQTVHRPSSWFPRMVAYLRTDAEINHIPSSDGNGGHFFAHDGEKYQQKIGENNCLLIAFHESLGETVTHEFIKEERNKFDAYYADNHEYYENLNRYSILNCNEPIYGGARGIKTNNKIIKPKTDPFLDDIKYEKLDDIEDKIKERLEELGVEPKDLEDFNSEINDGKDKGKPLAGTYNKLDKYYTNRSKNETKIELNHVPSNQAFVGTPYEHEKTYGKKYVIPTIDVDHRSHPTTGQGKSSDGFFNYRNEVREYQHDELMQRDPAAAIWYDIDQYLSTPENAIRYANSCLALVQRLREDKKEQDERKRKN